MSLDGATLSEVLRTGARSSPLAGVHFPDLSTRLTLAELDTASWLRARTLRAQGPGPGEVVGLLASANPLFLINLFGVLRSGAAVSVLPTPVGFADDDQVARRLAAIAQTTGMRHVLTDPAFTAMARGVAQGIPGLRVDDSTDLTHGTRRLPELQPDTTAVVQFTSGSTGRPRGVELTHRAVVAGLRAIVDSAGLSPRDVLVQWVPPYHDMGLFGLLAQVLNGGDAHLFGPMSFIRRPVRFLRYFAEQRATLLTSPNFGYDLLLRALRRTDPATFDLSSWRLAFNGAEPVSAQTVKEFAEVLAPAGVRAEVMYPVYGMAEATLAITFPSPGTAPRCLHVDRQDLGASGVARPMDGSDPAGKPLISCGRPVAGLDLRIIGDDGGRLGEDRLGEIQIRTESMTTGYYRDPEASAALFEDGWLRTGDLGFQHRGELYVAGRRKEMAVVHGQNHFPDDVERVARAVPGVYRGRCVSFAGTGPDGEHLAVIVEAKDEPYSAADLAERVRRAVVRDLGTTAVQVHVVRPHWLTKTTSGKWQRLLARRRLAAETTTPP